MNAALAVAIRGDVKEENEMAKSKALQVIKSVDYEGVHFDCYQGDGNEWYGTRDQIGAMLGYEEPNISIANIHNRNKARLDKFSTVVKLGTVEGDRTVTRKVIVYSFKGLLEICRYSNQPKADAVMDFLWDVADGIRKTGEYATPEAQREKADKHDELVMKRLDIMEMNANYRLAKLILEGMNKFQDVMTPESKTVSMVKYVELTTKHDMTHMLPPAMEKWYSATEIGREHGVSAQKIGRVANENKLKAPEGQSNEYGTWIRSQSKSGPREVMTWVYFEAGRAWFAEYFRKAQAV
jgi:prophage antirepressor-like protein